MYWINCTVCLMVVSQKYLTNRVHITQNWYYKNTIIHYNSTCKYCYMTDNSVLVAQSWPSEHKGVIYYTLKMMNDLTWDYLCEAMSLSFAGM